MCLTSWTWARVQAQEVHGGAELPQPRLPASQCYTDWSRRWLCPGDRVPQAGHLVEPEVLIRCAGNKRLAALLPQAQQQRDGCLLRKQLLIDDKQQLQEQLQGALEREATLQRRPTWVTFGLMGAGGALVGALLGLVAGVFL